jgi:hypothetical protein
MSDERFQKKIEGILEALRITLQVIADLQTTTTLPKKNICYFCNVPGHWIQKCPEIPPTFQDYCLRCWTRGHSVKDCKFTGPSPPPPWMSDIEYQKFLDKRQQ